MKKACNDQPKRAQKSGTALLSQGEGKLNLQAKQGAEKFEMSKKSKRARKKKKNWREK